MENLCVMKRFALQSKQPFSESVDGITVKFVNILSQITDKIVYEKITYTARKQIFDIL